MRQPIIGAAGLLCLAVFTQPALAEDTVSEGSTVELVDNPTTKQEDKRGYQNLVTLGFAFFPGTIKGSYRRTLNDKISVVVGGGFGSATWGTTDVSRVLAGAGMDYQPKGNGMHGFYVGPRVDYTSWSFEYSDTIEVSDTDTDTDTDTGSDTGSDSSQDIDLNANFQSQRIEFSGMVGWRWVWDPGASLALGIGPKFTTITNEAGAQDDSVTWGGGRTGIGFGTEVRLGWAF
jgi:hypothetical protein